jgi:hypothetical protein
MDANENSSRLSSCHGGRGRANTKSGCGSGGAVLRMDAKKTTLRNYLLTSCYKLLVWYARIGVIALGGSFGGSVCFSRGGMVAGIHHGGLACTSPLSIIAVGSNRSCRDHFSSRQVSSPNRPISIHTSAASAAAWKETSFGSSSFASSAA